MRKKFLTKSETETTRVAIKFAKTLRGGDIVLLEGDLGAGKTVFVRGLAGALGVRERIQSPTFVLMRVHNVLKRGEGRGARGETRIKKIYHLVHVDAYRVQSANDLRDIGIEEYLGAPDTVTIIEWGERARALCRGKKFRRVVFKHVDENVRQITTN